jgi:3-deoxy-D-manno-octulosonic-acid transferase
MEMCPNTAIAVTTTSATGLRQARELMPFASSITLAPLDVPWAIRRVLQFLQPAALILIETELWPNMITMARRRGCPVALVNGRMSDNSVRSYRWARGFFSRLLGKLDLVCVQTEADRERFAGFGVSQEKMATLGNLKYDLLYFLSRKHGPKPTRSSFGISPQARVIVAGSTRPGEEAIWLRAFRRIAAEKDPVILILAPRHLDRIGQIENLLAETGLTFRKRSEIDASGILESGILLLDTMGELLQVYSLADVAFVGGTLAPFGGHNLLEPAMWSVPVLFGPYQDHVRDIAALLLQEGAGIEVNDDDDIVRAVSHLLDHPEVRRSKGQAAYRIIEGKAGVSKKTVRLLQERGIL